MALSFHKLPGLAHSSLLGGFLYEFMYRWVRSPQPSLLTEQSQLLAPCPHHPTAGTRLRLLSCWKCHCSGLFCHANHFRILF